MDFRILGPVEVFDADRRLVLAGPKPRTLLAALLLEPGQPVAIGRLVDGVWGEQSPSTATALIQTYVSALRRAFPPSGRDLIVTRHPGYAIDVDPCEVDLTRFNTHAAKGRQAAAAGRHREAAEQFAAALALWRGPALGGLGESFMRAAGIRLDELRLVVTEERIAADLASGLTQNLVAELSELVHAHPLRERLRGQLMLALYRSGRQADALTVYREGREALIDELGIEPGKELRDLHESVLRGSADLQPATRPATVDTGAATPAQLPPATSDFVGRARQVEHVLGVLGSDAPAMTVCAVSGTAGTGKTALAVYAARKVAPSYPDGQLFATLRGAAAPVAPGRGACPVPACARREQRRPAGVRRGAGRAVPEPARRAAGTGRARRRAQRGAGPTAAARRHGLRRAGHQPGPARGPGGRHPARPRRHAVRGGRSRCSARSPAPNAWPPSQTPRWRWSRCAATFRSRSAPPEPGSRRGHSGRCRTSSAGCPTSAAAWTSCPRATSRSAPA